MRSILAVTALVIISIASSSGDPGLGGHEKQKLNAGQPPPPPQLQPLPPSSDPSRAGASPPAGSLETQAEAINREQAAYKTSPPDELSLQPPSSLIDGGSAASVSSEGASTQDRSALQPSASPRIEAWVISLQGQENRLKSFRGWWAEAWPSLKMHTISAVKDSHKGRGITLSFVEALDRALESGVAYGLFFEDDAKPFAKTGVEASISKLVDVWPPSSPVLLLGGHHITPLESPNTAIGITKIQKSQGAYAWAIRRQHMKQLRELWSAHADDATLQNFACDVVWAKLWDADKAPAFVATPLLVDHHDFGMASNTWGYRKVEYKVFEGKPNWWETCTSDLCSLIGPVVGVKASDTLAEKLSLPL